MLSSSMTKKGQVTIPNSFRKALGLHPGDQVGFMLNDKQLVITKKENNVKAAFGLYKSQKAVSLQQIEATIRKRGSHEGD